MGWWTGVVLGNHWHVFWLKSSWRSHQFTMTSPGHCYWSSKSVSLSSWESGWLLIHVVWSESTLAPVSCAVQQQSGSEGSEVHMCFVQVLSRRRCLRLSENPTSLSFCSLRRQEHREWRTTGLGPSTQTRSNRPAAGSSLALVRSRCCSKLTTLDLTNMSSYRNTQLGVKSLGHEPTTPQSLFHNTIHDTALKLLII